MASQGKVIPKKLKADAIIEALLEVRFETTAALPELVIGPIASHKRWANLIKQRTAAAAIPEQIRRFDPDLRYRPIIELLDKSANRAVRIGPQVISYHQSAPYVGWKALKPELDATVDVLFETLGAVIVRRLGLRYVNALLPEAHGIRSLSDLDLSISVGDAEVSGHLNLNLAKNLNKDTQCILRIATKDFVQGSIPPTTSVVVDVDVFTKPTCWIVDRAAVHSWVETAHMLEKQQFFGILTDQTIDALTEE